MIIECSTSSFREASTGGPIATTIDFAPGVQLHADPALEVSGRWRSPAGRLLELDVACGGVGSWIGLHVALGQPDLEGVAFLGFACRSVAREEVLVRACLRSGAPETEAGFSDYFFPRHLLSVPEPLSHVDALHLPTCLDVPEQAPWRELVLFLPIEGFVWHLHDLRLFAV